VKRSQRKSRGQRRAPQAGSAAAPQAASTPAAAAEPVPVITGKPSANLEAAPVRSWRDQLFDPIDIASIAVFRISFGLLLLYDTYTYFANGWIKTFYIDPPYHFAFFGFDFIRPLPGDGMYVLFVVLAICAVLVTVGLFYRVAMTVFFLASPTSS
jgi:hypothetical protein